MKLGPVFYVVGVLLCILSASMALPMLVDLYFHHPDWKVFLICMLTTFFFGGLLILTNRTDRLTIRIREGFLLTTISWVVISIFAALPLWFSELHLSLTDAVFEATSGITTTGATIIAGLDEAPPGILLWRAILQWLGGIGIIVMALSLLPFLGIGGMQLFRTESSENEKAMPRATELATSIFYIYTFLTVVCVICYLMAGFELFDAVAHAMTTISTGGFSTHDTSFMAHLTPEKEIVAIIFMIIGALPFVLYLRILQGNPQALYKDSQVIWFLCILGSMILLLSGWLFWQDPYDFSRDTLLEISFSVTAVITGTGYANADYNSWGTFPVMLLFFLMVVGGCAGSTSCGIKIFRFQIIYAVTDTQIKRLITPHGVYTSLYNGKPIPSDVPLSVMSFFFLFALSFTILAGLLSLTGLDYLTAMSGSASAIANVGPGLGNIIGPAGNYSSLNDTAKWLLSFGMILGRLELFTVMVLLLPRFWKP